MLTSRTTTQGRLIALVLSGALLGGGAAAVAATTTGQDRDATVKGYVQLCGGPAPGRCRVGRVGFCEPAKGCVTSDRVAAIDANGRRAATQKLHHARFRLRLKPGRYTIELLGDGKRVHHQVMQRKKVRARAGHTATVRFLFVVP